MEKTKSPLAEIFRARDIVNPNLAAAIAGRLGSKVEVDSLVARKLDRFMGRTALSFFTPRIITPGDFYADTNLWHGTGRYKHEKGEVKDVLKCIADEGSILPRLDNFDFSGPMETVSLARSRMYARAYADMFGHEGNAERYGTSLFWACAFLGNVAVEASMEMKVWQPKGYYAMMRHLSDAGVSDWYKKVTSEHDTGVFSLYQGRTDIADNYPILFGIRDASGVETSRAVALHEVRSEKPISLDSDVTHVEVPAHKIEETQRILAGVAIRAIEHGEAHSSKFSFTEHMHEII